MEAPPGACFPHIMKETAPPPPYRGTTLGQNKHFPNNQVATSRPQKSLNPYCVVTVNGREVARTRTIPESCDPLWATEIHLSDQLLGRKPRTRMSGEGGVTREMGINSSRQGTQGRDTQQRAKHAGNEMGTRGAVGTPARSKSAHSPPEVPPSPPRKVVSRVVLEVWDGAAEGQPFFLGAAELPSHLMSALTTGGGSGTAVDGAIDNGGGDGDGGVGAEVVVEPHQLNREEGSGPHYLNLKLLPRNKTSAPMDGDSGPRGVGVEETAAARELSVGVLSVSVERIILPSTFGEDPSQNGAEGEVGHFVTGLTGLGGTTSSMGDVENGRLREIGADDAVVTKVSGVG